MICNPRLGSTVQVWYAQRAARHMPYHARLGTVKIVSRGKPRNHGIEIDGQIIAIPCGNIRRAPE